MTTCFEVFGYWPAMMGPDGKLSAGRHIAAFVIAGSVSRAVLLVEERWPGVQVSSINRKGSRVVIIDEGAT